MMKLPRVSINTDLSEGLCFGCGQNNPIGLKLSFRREGRGVRAEFTPGKHYQGWPGLVHGGIIGCLIDEAMSYATHFEGVRCLTAQMEMQLKRPALLNEPLIITSCITRQTRKLLNTVAKVSLGDGTVVAEGKATQFIVETDSVNLDSAEEAGNNARRQA